MKTKIFTILLIPVVIILTYVLVMGVRGPIVRANDIKEQEESVKRKLRFIRELQVFYNSQKGEYAGRWDKLIEFAKTGSIFVVQRREIAIQGKQDEYRVEVDTIGMIPVQDSLFGKARNKNKEYQNLDELPFVPGSKTNQFGIYASKIESGNNMINVFEVRDLYPNNPARGAEFKENGEAYSVPTLLAHFEKQLKSYRDKAVELQKKQKAAAEADKKTLQKELDELSKYIGLYERRIERINTKPLRIGSRDEATTAGNWE
ncbi:MAG: hypothetical protein MUE85_21200 [Microscillaceae bacterium]|jgi:hypothetical protein|nr:hypothetical protein [Microscillaceae bacterium]